MKAPIPRQTGEHHFVNCGGLPHCATCGCVEDEAYVGGEECSFQEGDDKDDLGKKMGEVLHVLYEDFRNNGNHLVVEDKDMEPIREVLLEAGYTYVNANDTEE